MQRTGVTHIRILSDDSDVFVLLVYFTWKYDLHTQGINIELKKWKNTVYDINETVRSLSSKCRGLLAAHGLSGCDTSSFPCGKGKISVLNVSLNNDIEEELDLVFGSEPATHEDIMRVGRRFFLAMYGQKKQPSLNAAQFQIFRSRKKAPSLQNLPPTDVNSFLGFLRAHGQCKYWKAGDKDS